MVNDKVYPVRGVVFQAVVVRQKTPKTAVVEREIVEKVPKFERRLIKRVRTIVHVPDGINVSVGDSVQVGETRKISKTKNFVIMSVLNVKKVK